MKHLKIIIASLLMVYGVSAWAGEHDMPGMGGAPDANKHDMQGMGKMSGGTMPGMMSTEELRQIQTQMLLMHDLSNKILAEKDPQKQQALKDQQLEVMKTQMMDRIAKQHKKMLPPLPPAEKK